MSAPLLLIDVGNTRVKWATATRAGLIRGTGEIVTAKATTAWMGKLAKKFPAHRVVLSSVVPKLVPHFRDLFQKRFHLVATGSPALGVTFNYPKPKEIGADRLAAAAAICHEGIKPAIIVQCGTASAFSVLDSNGRFCGGVIAPGPQAQLVALIGATAQLPMTTLNRSVQALGRSTTEAIRAGVMLNFRGGINEILRELTGYFPAPQPRIFLTGGNAALLGDALDLPFTLRPLLVFEGLRIIGLRAFKDV